MNFKQFVHENHPKSLTPPTTKGVRPAINQSITYAVMLSCETSELHIK